MARMRNLPAALAWALAVVIAYLERRDPVRTRSATAAEVSQGPGRERTSADVPPPPETESAAPSPAPSGEPAVLFDAAEPPPGAAPQAAPSAAEPTTEPSETGEPIAGPDAQIASPAPGAEAVPAGAVLGDGTNGCPPDFPIKGNASSMIYHRPGQPSYDRTIPEFCFASEHDAEAAGYRPPKR